MRKVYLVSSNEASQKDIKTVSDRLKELNVEIVTDHKECQSLIILPGKIDRESINIGKGIYTKVGEFDKSYSRTNPKKVAIDNVYVISYLPDADDDSLWVSNISQMLKINVTDWSNYGAIYLVKNSERNIKSVFGTLKEREDAVRGYNSNPCDEIPTPNRGTQPIGLDIIPVQAMAAPTKGLRHYFDFVYDTKWKNSKWKNLLIG
jgi:hypothetical protein